MELPLSDELRQQLRRMQRTEKDKRRYVKVTVPLMLDLGCSASNIALFLGIDAATVYRYREVYNEAASLGEYVQDNHVAYSGKLSTEESKAVEQEVNQHLYRSAKEVATWILKKYATAYSVSGVAGLLRRLGYVYKKTRLVSEKADRALQEEFREELLELLEAVETGKDQSDSLRILGNDGDGEVVVSAVEGGISAVYFSDAVHPQHNTRSSYGWIKSGSEFTVESNTGRDRVNINGAINAHDVSDVAVVESESVDSASTIALYKELEKKHGEGRIIVICDNARYYRSRELREWLSGSRIVQVFLPSYSPNLNLIERLWKFMRKKVIDAEYYTTKEKFREAILNFFKNIGNYRTELESLLTLNFHIP